MPFICGWWWLPGTAGCHSMGQSSCQCADGDRDRDRAKLPHLVPPAPSCSLSPWVDAGAGVPERSLACHCGPGKAAPGAHLAAAAHSRSNPKILLKHCPSILEHRLVASNGNLVLELLFAIFLEIFPLLWLLSGISGETYIFLQVHSISLLLSKQGPLHRCSQLSTEHVNQVALQC